MKITGRITQWSFSRWWDWVTCPYKAGLKHVLKVKEPGSPAMNRGTDVHKLGEDYLRGTLKKLPAEFNRFKDNLAALRKYKAEPEGEWAFNEKMQPRGWFDKDVWVRIKIDAFAFINAARSAAEVVDYKTGKEKEHHDMQLSLYALGSFHKHASLETTDAQIWYLDQEVGTGQIYARSELKEIEREWRARVAPMLADTKFKATPNQGCRYCHFRKSNGGPCKNG
jgi:CRISPR/Cas system-associated exonuclease Cas4 (RecB family)